MQITATCKRCSTEFIYEHRCGALRKYCGPVCRKRVAAARRKAPDAVEAICERCGAPFSYGNYGGRRRKYCDQHRTPERNTQRFCVVCSKPVQKYKVFCSACKPKKKRRKPKDPGFVIDPCVRCGTAVKRRPNRKTAAHCKPCACKKASEVAANRKRAIYRGEGDWSEEERAYFRSLRKNNVSRLVKSELDALRRIARFSWEPCQVCGKRHKSKAWKKHHLCSSECRAEHNRRMAWEAGTKGAVKACSWCGIQWCSLRGTSDDPYGKSGFCSDLCRRLSARRIQNDAKKRRRARIRGNDHESINRLVVFRRDKWTCQACGCHTPKDLMGSIEDDAPELDHIVALAAGGSHTYDNVQLLCRVCNLLKGILPMDEFVNGINGLGGGSCASRSAGTPTPSLDFS